MTTVAMLGATGNLGRAIGGRFADRAWTLIEIPRSIQTTPQSRRMSTSSSIALERGWTPSVRSPARISSKPISLRRSPQPGWP